MQIDADGATLFGNMTQGGGLTAVFDSSTSTVAYVEYSVGWAGVSLLTPKRIDTADLTSYVNGFDSSGLTSAITLQLRAKNGAAPTGYSDGVLLGSASFTDQNILRTIAIASSDKVTEYSHVWAVVFSGVWSTLVGVKLYEAPEPEPIPEPEPLPAGSHVFLRSCNQNIPLSKVGVELYPIRIRVLISEPRHVLLDFHGDVIHVGNGPDAGIAVGWSFWIAMRSAPTLAELGQVPFTTIRNAVGGGNVSERNPQHYGNKTITTAAGEHMSNDAPLSKLSAGAHEFTVFGNCHTDGSSTDGLIQVLSEYGRGLNCLRVTVLP